MEWCLAYLLAAQAEQMKQAAQTAEADTAAAAEQIAAAAVHTAAVLPVAAEHIPVPAEHIGEVLVPVPVERIQARVAVHTAVLREEAHIAVVPRGAVHTGVLQGAERTAESPRVAAHTEAALQGAERIAVLEAALQPVRPPSRRKIDRILHLH